jgi:hypothetical protein
LKLPAIASTLNRSESRLIIKLQQQLAQEQFPNDKIGVALAKFYATPHGAEMLNVGLKLNYEAVQRANALSAGVPLAKAWGNPASRQSEFENPDVTKPSNQPRISEGQIAWPEPWNKAVFDKAVELLMRKKTSRAMRRLPRFIARKKRPGARAGDGRRWSRCAAFQRATLPR